MLGVDEEKSTLSGGDLRAPCPVHGGTKPNFAIRNDDGRWICRSRGCHREHGGKGVDLIAAIMGCDSVEAKTALRHWLLGEFVPILSTPISRPKTDPEPVGMGPHAARRVWEQAFTEAHECGAIEEHAAAWDYLFSRGLMDSWEHREFGVLSDKMELPEDIVWWPERGYRVIVPLRGDGARVTSFQGLNVWGRKPKTILPKGGAPGVFMSWIARNEWPPQGWGRWVICEGITDFLALSIHSAWPVLGVPGASRAPGFIGPWVEGVEVVSALDNDPAGRAAASKMLESVIEFGGLPFTLPLPEGGDVCDLIGLEGGIEELTMNLSRGRL
jgi:hypothetical protein